MAVTSPAPCRRRSPAHSRRRTTRTTRRWRRLSPARDIRSTSTPRAGATTGRPGGARSNRTCPLSCGGRGDELTLHRAGARRRGRLAARLRGPDRAARRLRVARRAPRPRRQPRPVRAVQPPLQAALPDRARPGGLVVPPPARVAEEDRADG